MPLLHFSAEHDCVRSLLGAEIWERCDVVMQSVDDFCKLLKKYEQSHTLAMFIWIIANSRQWPLARLIEGIDFSADLHNFLLSNFLLIYIKVHST